MSSERCKDVVGRHARLLREVRNRGGAVYPAGTIMLVDGTWRGRFDLRALPKDSGTWRGVMKVSRGSFVIVETAQGATP